MKHLLSVVIMMLALTCCTSEADRIRMRAGLDSINMRNRNDQPFTVSDVQPYVTFFDEHGTANDRLLAHYLLGRAYYDHGEAPMALKCYQDAIECADTLSTDCDYSQLARVYGQMSEIFNDQGLYSKALSHDKISVGYAWKGRDTLLALRNFEQIGFTYKRLGYIDSAMVIFENVSKKYFQYGYPRDAAISIGANIKPLINNGDLSKAKEYMELYESQSGFFDALGNIEAGREIYYKTKGLYYLHTNQLDSAEYYFRKELRDGKDFNNQNAGAKGMVELYQRLHKPDSVAKYSLYAYAMSDSLYAKRTTKEIERIQAMYDYTRHQEVARQESEKAANEKTKRNVSIAILIFVVIVAILIIYKLQREKKKKQLLYIRTLESLEQTQSEVLLLREHAEEYEELIAMKERLLQEQNDKLQELRMKALQDHAAIDEHIKGSAIYQTLQGRQQGQKLTSQELRDCRKLVLETLPAFNQLLLSKQYTINAKDFDVCMLFRLGFKSKEVSNMLDITQGRVSQIVQSYYELITAKTKISLKSFFSIFLHLMRERCIFANVLKHL